MNLRYRRLKIHIYYGAVVEPRSSSLPALVPGIFSEEVSSMFFNPGISDPDISKSAVFGMVSDPEISWKAILKSLEKEVEAEILNIYI